MSLLNSTVDRRRTGVGIGLAAGAAFGIALLSMGTANAESADGVGAAAEAPSGLANSLAAVTGTGTLDNPVINTYPDPNGWVDLFGAQGDQGIANNAADLAFIQSDPGNAAAFDTLVESFLSQNAHPLVDLVNAIDPSAFYYQISEGVLDGATPYLVPDDFLGYLAQDLDFLLLNPTGLGYILDPLIDLLLGQPFP